MYAGAHASARGTRTAGAADRAGWLTLRHIRYGKYAGRVVARASAEGVNLSDALLAAGLARPYDGGTRAGWCDAPGAPAPGASRSGEQRHAADGE